ncbi:MAG: EamA family transporter, partial [Clostridia bacterium]|nr:EamA family transporter [Clostridia bacterium]
EPMAATIFSVTIFGEKLSLASLVGIVLILASVFLLSKTEE